jgi:BirA family transcriptional regulator, biotin operon repressor / biotin---[acetyl-CoA-carboxylase] ligase
VTGSPLAGIPRDIAEALAARSARLGAFASRVIHLDSTSSTNDVADRLAADGAPHGTLVEADAQQSGRGRMGRTWFSPPGAGLYVSVVLRPEQLLNPAEAGFNTSPEQLSNPAKAGFHTSRFASAVSLTAGVALAEGIRAACGLDVAIKWPNDLVIERRKLCGVLAEASSRAGELQHVILGYGINVRAAAYPPEIAHRATSLETELGREVDRAAVLAETLASLAEWLDVARLEPCPAPHERRPGAVGVARGFMAMLDRWRQLSPSSVGSAVEVMRSGGAWVPARTAGVDDDGALRVAIEGKTERVIAGEVRWM